MEQMSDLVVALPVVAFTILAPVVIVAVLARFVRQREQMSPERD